MKFILVIFLVFMYCFNYGQQSNKQLRSFDIPTQEGLKAFDGPYKFTITIFDKVSQTPLQGVDVKLLKSENNFRIMASKKNGKVVFSLIQGTYSLMIEHENYQFFMNNIVVGNDGVNEEFIYLSPKKGIRLVPVVGSKLN